MRADASISAACPFRTLTRRQLTRRHRSQCRALLSTSVCRTRRLVKHALPPNPAAKHCPTATWSLWRTRWRRQVGDNEQRTNISVPILPSASLADQTNCLLRILPKPIFDSKTSIREKSRSLLVHGSPVRPASGNGNCAERWLTDRMA